MLKVFTLLCLLSFSLAIQFNINLSNDVYSSGDNLFVNWDMISDNKGALLKWGTPFEGEWNSNMFYIVSENNNRAIYNGKLMKRAVPSLEDYHLFTSNVYSGSLDLSEGYKFIESGTYSITLRIYISLLNGDVYSIESNTVSVSVIKPDTRRSYISNTLSHPRDVGFTDCSSSETNVVNAAIPQATSASDNASQYMNQTYSPSCDSTYVTWFGTLTEGRWNKVQTDFSAIHSRLGSRAFNIDCSCKQPGTYAFVYPNDPTHTIHLCPVFWDASPDPYTYNSQPGTLTHEMSHFDDVAGTGDYQYGVPGCYQLAESSPNVAVDNADSHEFFQESQPTC